MVVRGFHLHPIAIIASGDMAVEKSIDWNLGERVLRKDTHVVCDPNELALAEISPSTKSMPRQQWRFSSNDVVAWSRKYATDFHWWLLSHQIRLAGTADCGDTEEIEELMGRRNGLG